MKGSLPIALLVLISSALTTTSLVSIPSLPSALTSSSLSQPIYNMTNSARPNNSSLPDNNNTTLLYFDPEDKRGGGGSSGGGGGGGHGSSSIGASKGGGSSGSSGSASAGGAGVGANNGRPIGAGAPPMAVDENIVIYKVAILGLSAFWMGMVF